MEPATHMGPAEYHGAEQEHEGVSFRAWGFVLAGLDAGLRLEDLLTHLDLGEERWRRADEAFNEALLDDVEAGGTLSEQLDCAMRAARRSWVRPVPPLDADLRSWLDFFRAWANDRDPIAFLGAHGLRASDMHRLHEQWTVRLREDPALQVQALAILEAPPGPVPEPLPEPPRLVAAVADDAEEPDGTLPSRARAARSALPFVDGEPAPAHPRLSVALPVPPPRNAAPRARADETRVVALNACDDGAVLPFVPPVDAADPMDPPSPPGRDDAIGALEHAEERDPVRDFPVQRYAQLCVDLIESPDGEDPVLRRFRITALQKAEVDAYWTQRMRDDTAVWLAWDRACAERRAAKAAATEES